MTKKAFVDAEMLSQLVGEMITNYLEQAANANAVFAKLDFSALEERTAAWMAENANAARRVLVYGDGRRATGKSVVMQEALRRMREAGYEVIMVSPTGRMVDDSAHLRALQSMEKFNEQGKVLVNEAAAFTEDHLRVLRGKINRWDVVSFDDMLEDAKMSNFRTMRKCGIEKKSQPNNWFRQFEKRKLNR